MKVICQDIASVLYRLDKLSPGIEGIDEDHIVHKRGYGPYHGGCPAPFGADDEQLDQVLIL